MSTGVGTTEMTAEIRTADGKTTGPVPVDALERAAKQLPLFEGKRYPAVTIALAGGVEGEADFLLPEVTALKIGQAFHLEVHGVVTAKKHALKFDKEGDEIRTLVVTLKVDDVHLPE